MPAAIRITVARFYSPLKNSYSGRGIVPDLVVEQEGEASLAAARQEASRRVAAAEMPLR
jgi:C-terminal processing protease CtpA/Prc